LSRLKETDQKKVQKEKEIEEKIKPTTLSSGSNGGTEKVRPFCCKLRIERPDLGSVVSLNSLESYSRSKCAPGSHVRGGRRKKKTHIVRRKSIKRREGGR